MTHSDELLGAVVSLQEYRETLEKERVQHIRAELLASAPHIATWDIWVRDEIVLDALPTLDL